MQCSPGNDGGSAQKFLASVFVASTKKLLAEITSKTPKFHVKGLIQGQDYLINIVSVNKKGSSDAEEIDAIRLNLKVHLNGLS